MVGLLVLGSLTKAAASGLETGLIEMQDFAEGTSSRSTNWVHGGLRYLKRFDWRGGLRCGFGSAVVQQIAPHVPKPDPMLLPVYEEEGATFRPLPSQSGYGPLRPLGRCQRHLLPTRS